MTPTDRRTRELHRTRDLDDVWLQHDGIVAGVQDGRICVERERGEA